MEPSQDDGFKWFGEGFDGFPKILHDDTVEYAIYIIDNKLNQQLISSRLKQVLKEANLLINELLHDYIWQRDAFALELKFAGGNLTFHVQVLAEMTNNDQGTWSLHGRTNYGDSVADEWLIVYLLRELSLKNPDIWIRIYDSDGEFLLIEAANALPKWIKPEIAANRVWLHAGSLKLIPHQASRALETRAPTLQEAILYIQSRQQTLVHSPLMEAEAFFRIGKYPQAIDDNFHHSIVRIPRKVAYMLKKNHIYISPAIEAFYLRDPIALKPLQASSPAGLTFPPEDFINTSVRFTKVGFAQLKSQEFTAPETWLSIFPTPDVSSKDKARLETGMKLSCGFEMLLQDPSNSDKKPVREMQILLQDLENGDETLPSPGDLSQWGNRDDKESWMDIDFNDFDKELGGNAKSGAAGAGFGDKDAQDQLRKMVSRFEAFLNDDKAGLDGADLDDDDTDSDDMDSEDDDIASGDGEDKEVSFDEVEFARAMREMMGLPPETETTPSSAAATQVANRIEHEDEQEDKAIKDISEQIESELKGAGVLDMNPPKQGPRSAIKVGKAKANLVEQEDDDDDDEKEEGEVNIDFELAKNMLEAFKSQGGAAGPAGNLMGLLGVKMPPDKDD
jgi:hypothetical protein